MTTAPDRRNSVFISYTHKDKRFVERMARDLRSLGCEVWLDEWRIKVGDSLLREVGKAIKEARWMVLVLSPAALASEWVNTELRSGLSRELKEKNVFVLPVVRKKVELPDFLRDRFYADFSKSYENGFRVLRDRIMGDYFTRDNASWLLVKNPLPEGFLSKIGLRGHAVTGARKWTALLSPLAGNNVRESLDLFSRVMASSVLYRSSYADYLHETAHTIRDTSSTESWFGNTGRLVLRRAESRVHGEYDWHGLSLPGQIEGEVRGNVILFDWSWRINTERGRGLFWTDLPNVLYGGWWADFDPVDESAILSKQIPPAYHWEFVKIPNLTIQDAMGQKESHNEASEGTSEPAPSEDSGAPEG